MPGLWRRRRGRDVAGGDGNDDGCNARLRFCRVDDAEVNVKEIKYEPEECWTKTVTQATDASDDALCNALLVGAGMRRHKYAYRWVCDAAKCRHSTGHPQDPDDTFINQVITSYDIICTSYLSKLN